MLRDNVRQQHAVCITGLERSYPEISHNIHYSLSNFYSGWRAQHNGDPGPSGGGTAASDKWRLEEHVAFFGVRPANDSWPTVRTDLPPLAGESIQTPCGIPRTAWFSAYAKTHVQRITYGNSFVQMMCDLKACHTLIQAHEQRFAHRFLTIARLRLDLAWETPLRMPPELKPNTVYTSRMNTKSGLNDKWGIGRREAMAVYLNRVELISVANKLYNKSGPPVTLRATNGKEGLLIYDCAPGSINVQFACGPRRSKKTAWQDASATTPASATSTDLQPVAVPSPSLGRRFTMTSESFLMWALWRGNVTIAYEPSWLFCKFGNSVNSTARTCVPRMRKRKPCEALICQGTLTDCACKNVTCAGNKIWYCQQSVGNQLSLDPYDSQPALY